MLPENYWRSSMNLAKFQDKKLINKSLAFLYTNNERSEGEIKETFPFTTASKRIQYQRLSRWQKSKTWASTSSPQIHHKYIYMWNNSYRTLTECRQQTSDFQKLYKFFSFFSICDCVCMLLSVVLSV